MTKNIRYELSKTLAEYFIYHLEVELTKPAKVTDYMTIEGPSFMDYTKKMIHDLETEFPDRKKTSPRFNFFKHWWDNEFMRIVNANLPYEETTFKTQNQIFYFKIMDIKNPNEERRNQFSKNMETTMKIFRNRGRNVTFEVIFSSEVRMLPILEKIIYIERLPFFKSKDLLYEQNIFIQRTAYQIIDDELKASYRRTDDILKAILPEQIIEELKKTGKVKPVLHNSVSILFCDLTGFTKISSELSPENLLIELDQCYTHFDKIVKMNGLEKIKTIGDSYMACSGIYSNQTSHAILAILAGMRIQEFLRKYVKSQIKKGQPSWKARVGIHSGSIIAGVLGEDRFNFDLWGDTVNVAQRMEASGEPNEVNVSKETMELTKEFFDFRNRGKLFVKGKGELEQFFVIGIKPELSINKNGKSPNKKFRKVFSEQEESKKNIV